MAEDKQFLLLLQPNDLSCSICISHYTFPSTLPCGHTFCRDCIERYWQENTKHICPVCQTSFQNKPELNKNTDIASLLELLHKQNSSTNEHCQSCTGLGPLKLCLPCMTPVCRDHLLLHSEDTPQQRHLLVNPLSDSSTWLCRNHKEGLKYFCEPHCSPLCPACVIQHEACKPDLLLHRYRANKDNILGRIVEVQKDITEKEHKIKSMETAYQDVQILVCGIRDQLTRDFSEMRDYIEKQERASFCTIQTEQDTAQREMRAGIRPLAVQIEELKKIKADLEDTLQNNWMDVLKDTKSNSSHRASPAACRKYIFDENRIADMAAAISEMKQSLLAHAALEHSPSPPKRAFEEEISPRTVPSTRTRNPEVNAPLDAVYRNLLQWACDISFDGETVNKRLSLLPHFKTVTVTDKAKQYPNHPRRFTCSQVLCAESFSAGCHYWEINAKACESWGIGAAAQEIGKGEQLGRSGCSWCVEWNKGCLSAWHANHDIRIHHGKPDTVGVLLDCGEKVISFYSVQEEAVTPLHSYSLHFQTKLFPAVWLFGLNEGNSLTINDLKRL